MNKYSPTFEDEELYLRNLELSESKSHISDSGMSPKEIAAEILLQKEKIKILRDEMIRDHLEKLAG